MSDRDEFIEELVQDGCVNADDHDVSDATLCDMVDMGWITPVGDGEYIAGNNLDLHLGHWFPDGESE